MAKEKLKVITLGTMLGLGSGLTSCDPQEPKGNDEEKAQTEVVAENTQQTVQDDPYGNVALFEASRSDIKFALAFVENYYPYIYWDGKVWTTGHGLTILYNADGTYTAVTKNTKVPTLEESDIFKGRYLTHEILPDIKKCITVPMDENTLIAACVLRYCIGHSNFAKSSFVKQLNAGKTGAELAKTLTGWRQQEGVLNRCYFFAALMAGEIQYSDLLDLRAEGCYNLTWKDIVVYGSNGQPVKDANGFYTWNFTKIKENLEKAKKARTVVLTIGRNPTKTVRVDCQLVKDIVPDYIWQEVSNGSGRVIMYQDAVEVELETDANAQNDKSYIAYQHGDYETALQAGKLALKLSETDKQLGAAHYNIGMAYLAMGKYGKAINHLQLSLAANKTNAAQVALDEAKQKQQDRRANNAKKAKRVGGVVLVAGVAAYGTKKYLKHRNGKHR